MRFFDSVPTNQSRLLTFRCPYYKTRPNVDHYLTVAWKYQDPKQGEAVQLLSENVKYVGKPLALFPKAIDSYKKDVFPLGTLFITCSCMPERNGKLCYISTDVVDANNIVVNSPAETTKIRKRLEDDFKVTNRLLIQIYDVLEDIQDEQRKQKAVLQQVLSDHSKVVNEQESLETNVKSMSKILAKLPSYLEDRFSGASNITAYQELEKETRVLEDNLSVVKEVKKAPPQPVRVVEEVVKKPIKTVKPVKEEKYLDLFDDVDSSLASTLDEKPKTKIPAKNAFSVTQVLNKSALAREMKNSPHAQDLEQIFMMDDDAPKKNNDDNE
ncbi:hypothetical protein [Candidatus Uabimicrobium amorphum]|uniref:Uncharacterized protein n=1 Tax=Uabimicrobium amorphum TaxID=2596890 RepID=A0A5S9F2B8_UABAM|nr:hypothetical protein [Candidatus Uabimicrobium amorphum]BBM81942.1 hypothetical protein UABAM_00285 [Candidatus Uabimicrobium amorphum]